MNRIPNFRTLENIYGVTWRELVELEPRLTELLCAARLASVTCLRWSDLRRAFAPIRTTLVELIGFAGRNHRHPVLGGPGAYQVAYWKLFDAVAGPLAGCEGTAEVGPEQQRGESAAETAPTESSAARDATDFVCRSDRSALAFRIGVVVLGAAGLLLGACMPYSHPVALSISVLWWSVFLGCLGGSLAVVACVLSERAPASVPAPRRGPLGGTDRVRAASTPATRSTPTPSPVRLSA
jgi:hypothetical protein